MERTYAYSGAAVFGALAAIAVYAVTDGNIVLTVLALIGAGVVSFVVIRALEKLLTKGVDKAVDAAASAINKIGKKKDAE